MNKVYLEFGKSDIRLAGFPYGKSVYENQIKEKINNYDEGVEIVFPGQIEKIASSFIQGFFSDLINEIGYEGINEKITIITNSQELTNSIMENLF